MEAVAPLMTEVLPGTPEEARTGAWDDASGWVDLFRDLAAGDPERLGPLYDMASRRLYGLALWRTGSRELAADVVQEVFVRIAQCRDRLGEVRDPRWWLLSVTHRLAVDAVRRAGTRSRSRNTQTWRRSRWTTGARWTRAEPGPCWAGSPPSSGRSSTSTTRPG